ncbi:MAG: NAD-binding protein [Sulfurospirillum sp.]
MQIIIAGAGKVGYMIAKHLMVHNNVTVIDKNEAAIKKIEENLDVLAVCGDIENPHTYLSVDSDIDLFIGVTDSDEVNMVASLIIDKITKVNKKIIRLRNSFFADDLVKERLGINDFVVPAFEAAQPFKYLLDFPIARNVKSFEYTKALLVSLKIPDDFEAIIISSFTNDLKQKIVAAGIERNGEFYIPNDADMLNPGDLVYFYAYPKAVKELQYRMYPEDDARYDIRNCVIFGADSLGLEIAKVLIKKDLNIQIVDRDLKKCEKANLILKDKVTVIKSTYDSDHMLESDGVNPDLFIVSSGNDEYNITKCMEAKYYGINKVITINNDIAYSELMRNLNLEVVRGEKINAYYSILEKIESSKIVIKRQFCGGEGVLMIRKIFAASDMIGEFLSLSSKLESLGGFFIQRDGNILKYNSIESFLENDIIVAITKKENSEMISNWLHQS